MGRAFEFRKTRKMKRWGAMAQTFTKLGRQISRAVKDSGPDPETNSKLRAIIQNAKMANMPKENVERAIKKASSKDESAYEEVVYEGYGPHGIAFVIETLTDNPTRTVANVRSYLTRSGGSLGTMGSNAFLFERKCIFKIKQTGSISVEELEFELIDFGAEEVGQDGDEIVIYGTFEAFGSIQGYLEEKGYEVLQADLERVPMDTKKLEAEQEEEVGKLIEKLEEDEDVQNIFHTMA